MKKGSAGEGLQTRKRPHRHTVGGGGDKVHDGWADHPRTKEFEICCDAPGACRVVVEGTKSSPNDQSSTNMKETIGHWEGTIVVTMKNIKRRGDKKRGMEKQTGGWERSEKGNPDTRSLSQRQQKSKMV